MGEPNNSHFYDFGNFGRVPEPQYFYLWRPQDTLRKSRNMDHYFLLIAELWKYTILTIPEKTDAEQSRRPV